MFAWRKASVNFRGIFGFQKVTQCPPLVAVVTRYLLVVARYVVGELLYDIK